MASGRTRIRNVICVWLACLALLFFCHRSVGQTADQPVVEDQQAKIASATQRLAEARRVYQLGRQLKTSGSISAGELRRLDLRRKIALLDLADLKSPSQKNKVLRAKVNANYLARELEVAQRLHARGAMSAVQFRRIQIRSREAELQVKKEEADSTVKRDLVDVEIAEARRAHAEREFRIADRLLRSGSLSQQQYDLAAQRLAVAEQAVAVTKRGIGVRAVEATPE